MIRWFWKHRTLMRRFPVLMALLAGFMFSTMPAGKQLGYTLHSIAAHAQQPQKQSEQARQLQKSASGEELPVYEPGFMALAQVAPLQFFFYQAVVLPEVVHLVKVVEQAAGPAPDLVNQFQRILFRRIISPNAP